jgi:hypothetical protein
LDEVVRRVMAADDDSREVFTDPKAGYFGIDVGVRELVPAAGAMLGEIHLDDWLRQSAVARTAVG